MYARLLQGFGAAHDLVWSSLLPADHAGAEEDDGHETDQVMQFFDDEFELKQDIYRAVLATEELEELDRLKVPYMNCVTAIDHQNEQIVYLLQQLASVQREREALRRAADVDRLKDAGIQVAQIKLDLSDRKTKRNLKNQERANSHYLPLMRAINSARLKVFDAEQQRRAEFDARGQPQTAAGEVAAQASSVGAVGPDGAAVLENRAGGGGLRQRRQRPKHIPDSVIAQALKTE